MQITPEEVQKLGERQTVEFKKSLSLQREAMEALCGMVNSDNGTGVVLFGVAPNGSVAGVEPSNLDSAQKSLALTVRQKFDPPIICSIEIVECDGKSLVLLKADRAAGISYHEYDGRAYIREGSSRRQLSFDEKQRLSKKRNRDQHNGPWRCSRCGSFVGMLSSIVITAEGIKKSYDCQCGGEFRPAI